MRAARVVIIVFIGILGSQERGRLEGAGLLRSLTLPAREMWLSDVDEAMQLARKTGKPIFAVFH